MRCWMIAVVLALPPSAASVASSPATPAEQALESAQAFLKQYLDTLVKAGEGKKPKPADVARKLLGARKYLHPKTLELIAAQEKKGLAANSMSGLAAWNHAKADYWLTKFTLVAARPSDHGSVVVDTREHNWRVDEGGEDAESEVASYLLARVDGRWLLVEKRRNETFTDEAVKAGYPEYFESDGKTAKQPAKTE